MSLDLYCLYSSNVVQFSGWHATSTSIVIHTHRTHVSIFFLPTSFGGRCIIDLFILDSLRVVLGDRSSLQKFNGTLKWDKEIILSFLTNIIFSSRNIVKSPLIPLNSESIIIHLIFYSRTKLAVHFIKMTNMESISNSSYLFLKFFIRIKTKCKGSFTSLLLIVFFTILIGRYSACASGKNTLSVKNCWCFCFVMGPAVTIIECLIYFTYDSVILFVCD